MKKIRKLNEEFFDNIADELKFGKKKYFYIILKQLTDLRHLIKDQLNKT